MNMPTTDRLKLVTMIGTRPEIIRLSEVIKKADKYFNHILVHTGQNWDFNLNQVFFDDLGLRKPAYYLDAVGEDLGEDYGNIISSVISWLLDIKTRCILILGDTNSALSAISAKRLKIRFSTWKQGIVALMRTSPEETNRRLCRPHCRFESLLQ
jgi:UDP-N-acetylglucosamine 2-epimerase (non-hydrolysing)